MTESYAKLQFHDLIFILWNP